MERRLDNVRDHIAAVHDPPHGEDPSRDHQTVRADDPVETDPQLVGAGAVMGVQEQDLRNRVPQCDGLEPPAQPDQVPRVERTSRSSRLAGIDRNETRRRQGGQHMRARDEGVRPARSLMSGRRKGCRDSLTQDLGRQRGLKSAAMGGLKGDQRSGNGVHVRTPDGVEAGRDCPRRAPHAAAQPSMGVSRPARDASALRAPPLTARTA